MSKQHGSRPLTHASDRRTITSQRFLRRIVWGAKAGVAFGFGFAVLAVLLRLVGGAESLDGTGFTLTSSIVMYLSGGLISGTTVGALLPLAQTRAGATVVGAIAAIPVAVLLNVTRDGPAEWTVKQISFVAFFSLVLGAPTGAMYHRIFLGASTSERDKDSS